ncbi:MAG: isoaspartyl peptidase/L-asparaginase family protein [bacterium]|jgi:beta-aspartyl-peptidase (threonine type)|nr:isoaspartyl peptidase/L-asparaginase family protein [bacterium]
MKPIIIVHGGAGTWKNKDLKKATEKLKSAARRGLDLMTQGANSLEAVEQSVIMMENSGLFNAGRGACRQKDGTARMDASIMRGGDLACGAVGAIEGVRNPISAARKVMESTDHVLLTSHFAAKFAVQEGLAQLHEPLTEAGGTGETVGAVAMDRAGLISAGTSTGGLSRGMDPGRIGDSALVGCGTYANEYCGVSATGHGEAIIAAVLARRASEYVELGLSPQEAAEEAIQYLQKKTGGTAGLIILDRTGRSGADFNTPHMLWDSLTAEDVEP